MRFLRLLALTALSLTTVVGAKKPASDGKFDTYFARQASSSAPFELDESGYNELTSAPRDYSLAVLLTALDARYACGLCREFDTEWKILGRSWQKNDRTGQHRVLLSTLDFDQGRNVFMKVYKTYKYSLATLTTPVATIADRPRPVVLPSHRRRERQTRRPTGPL
jgi:oligosaccharyltransferase complex subunit gamma